MATLTASTTEPDCSFDSRGANSVPHRLTPAFSPRAFPKGKARHTAKKEPPTYLRQAESITSKSVNDVAASLRRELDGMFLMQMLYHARHHRLDGNVLNLVGISGGIARRNAGAAVALDVGPRLFERAEKIRVVVDIGNDKTERGRPGKFLVGKELQGGGVLVPGTVLFGLALAGRLVEERYRVNIREDRQRHTADG